MSDNEDSFEELWNSLRDNQKKVAQEYLFCATKAEAAKKVGLQPQTVYNWDAKVWEAASKLVDKRTDGISEGLSGLSNQAIQTLRRAMDPQAETSRVSKEAAEFIINHLQGRPTQKNQLEVSGGLEFSEDEVDLSHLSGNDEDDE
ncbi:hypothetical protein OSG_eHP25_00080 [environmental Halophage eHP-25]|nr:hypothetical protein OSG_eHP25_00080 [environmental Halophage eHP-25]